MHRIAWDSCVFLAWFKQEEDKPLQEIEWWLSQVSKGEAVLLVSTICVAEVLDTTDHKSGAKFEKFLEREHVLAIDVDVRIARKAATFRERATAAIHNGELKNGIKAPDAIIAASAALYKADCLHSFDPDLLNVSEQPIIDSVVVQYPALPAGGKLLPFNGLL